MGCTASKDPPAKTKAGAGTRAASPSPAPAAAGAAGSGGKGARDRTIRSEDITDDLANANIETCDLIGPITVVNCSVKKCDFKGNIILRDCEVRETDICSGARVTVQGGTFTCSEVKTGGQLVNGGGCVITDVDNYYGCA